MNHAVRASPEQSELQRSVIEGLKTWEFRLWRALTQGSEPGPGRPLAGLRFRR
jgi:hypothetical protein